MSAMESGVHDLVTQAKSEFTNMKHLGKDAMISKAYLYPWKGIFYFMNHPDLWRPMWLRLGPSIATASIVTILMFFFTYFPQVIVFGIFNGPLALINVFFLVLSESAAISAAISKTMFMQNGLKETFDATLIEKGSHELVATGRTLQPGGNMWKKIAYKVKAPLPKFSPQNVIQYLMYLPLNFIPVVGTIIFLYLQGKKYGPTVHQRYFELRRMNTVDADAQVENLRGAYTAFGVPAAMLEHLTAFTGIFFAYTNTVGAALWAHDMEHHLVADQEFQDFKARTNKLRGDLTKKLEQNPSFQGEAKQVADKMVGELQGQFNASLVGKAGKDLQAQIDQSAVGQVAQNLHAQTDALASGVLKGLPRI